MAIRRSERGERWGMAVRWPRVDPGGRVAVPGGVGRAADVREGDDAAPRAEAPTRGGTPPREELARDDGLRREDPDAAPGRRVGATDRRVLRCRPPRP